MVPSEPETASDIDLCIYRGLVRYLPDPDE